MCNIKFAPGMRIVVRGEEWVLNKVEKNSLGNQTLHCVGVTPLVKGREASFLDDCETVDVVDPRNVRLVLRENDPQYRESLLYLESQWRQKIPTDNNLHIGHSAAMDTLPYQLDPAKLALQRPRQRILIADAVGLGKTLEAGILMSELIVRGKGKRILVVTVKSMMTQFQKEMWNRFTIPLVRLDSGKIQKIRSTLPSNYNPFFYYDKTIISIDTLKQDLEYRTHLEHAYWDIIVIDEAQNVADRGEHTAQRAKLAKLLAGRSDTMIMLSATPHDGRAKSFASLMNMLDETAIANPEHYTKDDIKGLCIRRFKNDVRQTGGVFLTRAETVERCPASDEEERAFSVFTDMSLEMDAAKRRNGDHLFKTLLEKSMFSSPAACMKSIDERIKKLDKKGGAEAQSDMAKLTELKNALEKVTPGSFSRYQKLLELLKSPEYAWGRTSKNDRIVIFTERIETMNYLHENLMRDLGMSESQIVKISGQDSDRDQQKIVEDFGRTESPVRILVASDVASEGLNLHHLCHRLIHFDIPWSLMVFQQRNGRIDRYGQKDKPDIRYMYIQSGNEQIRGDMRIIEILMEKEKNSRDNIGDPASLLNLFSKEAEESLTMDVIENGSHEEELEKRFSDDKVTFDPLEALLKSLNGDNQIATEGSCAVTDRTLYTDREYVRRGVELINRDEHGAVEEYGGVLDINLTPEMRARLETMMPEEAVPAKNAPLTVSDDKSVCMVSMAESMQNNMDEKAWPAVQYLWKLHPIVSWLNDKLELRFKRDEAPVLSFTDEDKKGDVIFIVSGSIPNEKSTPLVDEWFGLRYRDGSFVESMTMEDVVQYTGLNRDEVYNTGAVTSEDVEAARLLLPGVVEKAQENLSRSFSEYEKEMNPKIDEFVDRLEQQRQIHVASKNEQLGPGNRNLGNEMTRTERIFDEYVKWVKETLTIKNNPYIRIIAVALGV